MIKTTIQLLFIFSGMLLFTLETHSQNSVNIKSDLTGIWDFGHSDGSQMQIYQDGKRVYGIVVNPNFAHYFVGRYKDKTTVKGAYIFRRNRTNGCETKFEVTLKIYNSGSLQLTYKAMDSNCDWLKGQSGVDNLTKKL